MYDIQPIFIRGLPQRSYWGQIFLYWVFSDLKWPRDSPVFWGTYFCKEIYNRKGIYNWRDVSVPCPGTRQGQRGILQGVTFFEESGIPWGVSIFSLLLAFLRFKNHINLNWIPNFIMKQQMNWEWLNSRKQRTAQFATYI
jgi:hypothetical protein